MFWITWLDMDEELMRGPIIVKFWSKKSLGLITVTNTAGPRESLHMVTSGWCYHLFFHALCFPGGSALKNPYSIAGDTGEADSIPDLGRSPGKRNGNPLQYSCLENPMDRGAWRSVGLQELDTTEHTHTHTTSSFCSNQYLRRAPSMISWWMSKGGLWFAMCMGT